MSIYRDFECLSSVVKTPNDASKTIGFAVTTSSVSWHQCSIRFEQLCQAKTRSVPVMSYLYLPREDASLRSCMSQDRSAWVNDEYL
jgi:hypothetical protein